VARDILIVDDEADIRTLIAGLLSDEGYNVREAGTSEEALDVLAERQPSLAILDVWLEGSRLDGLALLDAFQKLAPDTPAVMISGHGNIETAVAAIRAGAYDFIEKPFKADRLLLVVQRAMEAATLRRENAELRLKAGGSQLMVTQSSAARGVAHAVSKVAPTNSRVLISGPAGVGKESVARQIHETSRQASGPFVVVNCATIEPETMEISLFGAEAATADGARRIGTFEQAHGGTLLLDEVSDMPLETQAKILRVLQEQSFVRVGGASRVQVQVRVMATTSRDLLAAVREGRFREDLYYRLAVVPIEVPPLRQRREDIPVLAVHFLGQFAAAAGRAVPSLSPDAISHLQAYDWPGNVRQLRNTMERTLILAGDATAIGPEALPPEISGRLENGDQQRSSLDALTMPLRQAREQFERDYLLAQVERFGGNISKTAAFVGMERSALHRKLKSLGVQVGPDRP
jgi:two-component system, NtrC family, nitrogen regulation response regulator NtrX